MCRSVSEHPPAGLRCDKRDHLTPQATEAKRLARNARERELYHLRKNHQTFHKGDAETRPAALSHPAARAQLIKISNNPRRLSAGDHYSLAISSLEEREQLAGLLRSDQPEIAYLPVAEEDHVFSAVQKSTNLVRRLTLEDGTVGYFKSYDKAAETDEFFTTINFGHTYLGSALNEVAAYRLAAALGEGYSTLVPPTVIREHDGQLGSFQAEAHGIILNNAPYELGMMAYEGKADYENLRKAAIYDYICGAQDRHGKNFLTNTEETPHTVTLIDNGYCFPNPENTQLVCSQELINHHWNWGEGITPTPEERTVFQELHDSPNLKGVADLISPQSAQEVRKRLKRLLEEDSFDFRKSL